MAKGDKTASTAHEITILSEKSLVRPGRGRKSLNPASLVLAKKTINLGTNDRGHAVELEVFSVHVRKSDWGVARQYSAQEQLFGARADAEKVYDLRSMEDPMALRQPSEWVPPKAVPQSSVEVMTAEVAIQRLAPVPA